MSQQKIALTLLVIFISLFLESSLAKENSQTIAYIESSCHGTLYPNLCIRCLNKFSNSTINGPQHLAHIALSVSLSKALQTRGYLLKVTKELQTINHNNKRMYLTVQDCVNQINDSFDQLSQAIKELKRLNQSSTIISDKVLWHISNVETWVSTALTDASSCVQSLPGDRMSKRVAMIKVKAKNVAEVTSNALALFHSYASRYKQVAARTTKKP
ncbi:pectinesterase inhibitor 9-like [Cicer arietinum]|uniref:Pectinesterase inhibitor 9-like n=1 Tax=Cicer arietinum TaxID=3827 RepID=A0A1S2Z3F7_CICAR|nr:pectinesterase inhibitor 9-like [Cicer arietinum]